MSKTGDEELERLAKTHADTAMYYEPEYTVSTTSYQHGYRAAESAHQSETELLRKEVNSWKDCARSWMNSQEKAQKRIEKLRSVVQIVKEKTCTDPAEGPELRARAAFIYSLVHHALKADDKEKGEL